MKSRDAYKYLHNWLDAKQQDDTSVSIGPKGSYFARCGLKWITHGLPKDLETKLERNKDKFTPIHVALGVHGSWIVLWSDGDLSWQLRNSYPGLAQSNALKGGIGQVVFVALSAFNEDGYFVVGEDGCFMNTNLSSRAECEDIQRLMDDYMRERAKRDNKSFSYPVKIAGRTSNVYITPTTYDKRASSSLIEKWKYRRDVLLQKNNVAIIGGGAVAVGAISRLYGASPLKAFGSAATFGAAGVLGLLYGVGGRVTSSPMRQGTPGNS